MASSPGVSKELVSWLASRGLAVETVCFSFNSEASWNCIIVSWYKRKQLFFRQPAVPLPAHSLIYPISPHRTRQSRPEVDVADGNSPWAPCRKKGEGVASSPRVVFSEVRASPASSSRFWISCDRKSLGDGSSFSSAATTSHTTSWRLTLEMALSVAPEPSRWCRRRPPARGGPLCICCDERVHV